MRDLLLFYFKPQKNNSLIKSSNFFRNSLIIYFVSVIVYSTLSYIILNKDFLQTSPVSNSVTFYFLRTISLLLKQPVQVLFLSFGVYVFFRAIDKNKIAFFDYFKFVFISFNIIVLSYFVEILKLFTNYFNAFHIVNIFKYSLNDIFIQGTDCTNFSTSILERINILLILSIVYLFFLIKIKTIHISNFKLIILISISVLITLFLFASVPQFFLISVHFFHR